MPDDLPQNNAQLVAVNRGMEQRGIQIHGVVVATLLFPDAEHAGPAQGAGEPPNGTSRQSHGIRDLPDGAVGVDSDVEEDGAVAGNEIEGVNVTGSPP